MERLRSPPIMFESIMGGLATIMEGLLTFPERSEVIPTARTCLMMKLAID